MCILFFLLGLVSESNTNLKKRRSGKNTLFPLSSQERTATILIQSAPILKGSFSPSSFFNTWSLVPDENWFCAQYLVAKWPMQNLCTDFPSAVHLTTNKITRQLEDGFHSYAKIFYKHKKFFCTSFRTGKEIIYTAKSLTTGQRMQENGSLAAKQG